MTLVQKIKALCDQNSTNFAALERKLDFGQGSIRKWDTATPAGDRLAKVADYFGISVDYLLGREENKDSETPYYLDDDARQMAEDLSKNPDLHILFDAARTVSKEDLQFVINMVNRLKKDSE